jgi:hypothetical protein
MEIEDHHIPVQAFSADMIARQRLRTRAGFDINQEEILAHAVPSLNHERSPSIRMSEKILGQ